MQHHYEHLHLGLLPIQVHGVVILVLTFVDCGRRPSGIPHDQISKALLFYYSLSFQGREVTISHVLPHMNSSEKEVLKPMDMLPLLSFEEPENRGNEHLD